MSSIRVLIAAVLVCVGGASSFADAIEVEVGFSSGEIETIRAWYGEHARERGHGKGRKGLPPGIAKKLERGKPLPPGIAKQRLPAGLIDRLPPAPDGFERIIVDGKVLLVEVATQIIHDALLDVVLE